MLKDIMRYVAAKLEWLRGDEHTARAVLAQLRRGIGRAPGDQPELWGVLFEGMPDKMLSQNGTPSYAEWAVHTALTLFALHQQGKDITKDCMNQKDMPLGLALCRLCGGDKDVQKRIKHRFDAMATAQSMEETVYYLRGLIQLLRTSGIPLDYPALAKDLFLVQFPEKAPNVRLTWGQDFYREFSKKTNEMGDE